MSHVREVLNLKLERALTSDQREAMRDARGRFLTELTTPEPGIADWVKKCESLLYARAVVAGDGVFEAVWDQYGRLTGEVEDVDAAMALVRAVHKAQLIEARAQRSKSRGRRTEQQNAAAPGEASPSSGHPHVSINLGPLNVNCGESNLSQYIVLCSILLVAVLIWSNAQRGQIDALNQQINDLQCQVEEAMKK